MEKIITTNKADLIFKENGIVEKKFFESLTYEKELKSLLGLNEKFKEKKVDDWLYRVPKVLGKDDKSSTIIMTKVGGSDFIRLFKDNIEYTKHMGVWLGLYHNYSRKNKEKVALYGDFSRMNFIIDKENKIATAIDPGSYFGLEGFPEIDLMTGIYSLVIGSIKYKHSREKVIIKFINSYNEISNEKVNKKNLDKSWQIIKDRFKNKYKSKSLYKKPIYFLGSFILNTYITGLIKKVKNQII